MTSSDTRLKQHIAQHLKNIRSERKLSLDAVAELTGVSKAMLGQIERQESSPTIAKLWQITSGLETSFSAFLEPDSFTSAHLSQAFDDPNMRMTTLFGYDEIIKNEVFDIHLMNHHQQDSQAHAHGVLETIWVLEGELGLFFDNRWHTLKSNETLRFYADQPHSYKAITEHVRFQNIINYL